MPVVAGLDIDLIISLTFVGISAYIMQRAMRRLDPRVSNERMTKASAVAKRLLKGKGQTQLVLREHEIEVAADVVCPDDIDVTFAEIGGLSEQAKQLQQAILLPVRRPALFAQSKLFRSPKGILLHGPPGTGKTMLVRAIAREARFTFLCVNLARLFSKWYGESNKFAEAVRTTRPRPPPEPPRPWHASHRVSVAPLTPSLPCLSTFRWHASWRPR